MNQEQIAKVELSLNNMKEKKSRIYFFVQDTKGNAKASVRLIYQMAKSLLDGGFNPIILHEKKEYAGVVAWLDEEYMSIPHKSIEGQNLEISPEDFIILPELYGYIMEQIANLPCAKIVFFQAFFTLAFNLITYLRYCSSDILSFFSGCCFVVNILTV